MRDQGPPPRRARRLHAVARLLRLRRVPAPAAWVDCAVACVACVGLVAFGSGFIARLWAALQAPVWWQWWGSVIPAAVAGAAFVLAWSSGRPPGLISLGLRSGGPTRQAVWALGTWALACAAMFGWGWAEYWVWRLSGAAFPDTGQTDDFVRSLGEVRGGLGLPAVLVYLVTAAFIEELLFRGVLLTRLRVICGAWLPAALLSSAAFGLLHYPYGGWGSVGPTALCGLMFALAVIRGGSLAGATLGHALFNLTIFWSA